MAAGLLRPKSLRQSQRQAAGSSELRKSCPQTIAGRNHLIAGHRPVELLVRVRYDQSVHDDQIDLHHFHPLLCHSVRPRKATIQSHSRHPAHLSRPLHVYVQVNPVQYHRVLFSPERLLPWWSAVDDGSANHATNRTG